MSTKPTRIRFSNRNHPREVVDAALLDLMERGILRGWAFEDFPPDSYEVVFSHNVDVMMIKLTLETDYSDR